MRPGVKLADDLVIGQPRGHDRPHNLVGGHARHSYVSRATKAVLARIAAPAGIVDCFGSVGRVDHDWPAAQPALDQFQKLSQPLQVYQRRGIWDVVQAAVVGTGQFRKCEIWGQWLPGSALTAPPRPSAAATPCASS